MVFCYGGACNKELINKVFRLQKRAMRTISNSPYLCPTKPLFTAFNCFNIFDMYLKETSIFMFKYKHGLLPSSFNNFFTTNCENHKYNTRNKNDFEIPIHRIKTISSTGPKLWNRLPSHVKEAKPLGHFKKNIKRMLLDSN